MGSASAAGLASTPQPKFQHDNQNTGQSQYTGPQTNTTKWKNTTLGISDSSVTIGSNDTLYFGSYDSVLGDANATNPFSFYALNSDGTLKWKYAGLSAASSPAISSDGTIYVGSTDGILFALNANGTQKWNYTIGTSLDLSPAIGSNGIIYIASSNSKLYAINPNGTLYWKYTCNASTSPAIGSNGTIYIGSYNSKLYAINPNGTLHWKYSTGQYISTSPAVGPDGTIYLASDNLYAINTNGTLKWKYAAPGGYISISSNGTIYYTSYNSTNQNYQFNALKTNGALKWKYINSYPFGYASIGSDGTIYLAAMGPINAINPNGTLKWIYQDQGLTEKAPAIGSDGTLYCIIKNNVGLYAIKDIKVVYVNSSNGNDANNGFSWATAKQTIKTAIDTVSNGGTVNIANGVYKGAGNTAITINKNLTITGQSQSGTIINGTNTGWMFFIPGGNKVTIQNLTFANGNAVYGGAIGNYGNLTVKNCTFTGNNAHIGGAIQNVGSNSIISNCTFINNTATQNGGAIDNQGTLTVTGNTFNGNTGSIGGAIHNTANLSLNTNKFNGNTATDGGAIYNTRNSTVTNCNFDGNNATYSGAIYNGAGSNLNVTGCNFTNNTETVTAGDAGSAIYNRGIMAITSSKFTGNTAISGSTILNDGNSTVKYSTFTGNNGGAILNERNDTLTIIGSTFTNNTVNSGGAILNAGNCTISGSTFSGNNATGVNGYGGAIDNVAGIIFNVGNYTGNLTVNDCTFTDNNATTGGAVCNFGNANVHFSRIVGNTASQGSDIYNSGGTVDVNYNWWGSNTGPVTGRIIGAANPTSWMVLKVSTSSSLINSTTSSIITTKFTYDNQGVYHNPASGYVPDGINVIFSTNLGTINSPISTVNGTAKSTLKAGSTSGIATVSVNVDNQTVHKSVTIDIQPPKVSSTKPTNNATNVSLTLPITVKFTENIYAGTNFSKIYVKNLTTGKTVAITASISGNTLTIKQTQSRLSNNTYQVYIPKSAVKDLAGNNLAAVYTFKFKT